MRARLDAGLDVLLQVRRDPLHVDEQARHEDRGHERENPLPERAVGGPSKEQKGAVAAGDRDGRAGVDGAGQIPSAGAREIGEDERDDQEHLDPFAQRDREPLPHGSLGPPGPGLTSARGRGEYRN